MERVKFRPLPKDWELVIIDWEDILNPPNYQIKEILDWIDNYDGGRYHLQGYQQTNGFEFRFENPKVATYFKLKWL
jgi:hypothetical protein